MSYDINIMEQALNSMVPIRKGDIIDARVVIVNDGEISLDVHQSTEATMKINHFTLDKDVTSFIGLVNVGDIIRVKITKVESNDLYDTILCSRLDLLKDEMFTKIEAAKENNELISAKVVKKHEKGYTVDINGIYLFMPLSLSKKDIKIGDEVEVLVIDFDPKRRNGIVSSRKKEDNQLKEKLEEELSKINVGDTLDATVVRILDFGAVVRFENVEAILRLPDISHEFIKQVSDVLNVGDKVKVKVLTKNNNKITVSRKALLKSPYELLKEKYSVNSKVKAKVIAILTSGVVLELDNGFRTVLYQEEYDYSDPRGYQSLETGKEIEILILEFNDEKQDITVSRKRLFENPWEKNNFEKHEVVSGKILEVKPELLKVDVNGIITFVTKDYATKDTVNSLNDVYHVGDEFNASVTEYDKSKNMLRLSIKHYLINKEKESKKEEK